MSPNASSEAAGKSEHLLLTLELRLSFSYIINVIKNYKKKSQKPRGHNADLYCYLLWGVNSRIKGIQPRTYYPVGCHIEYIETHRRRLEGYMMTLPPSIDLHGNIGELGRKGYI